MTSKKSLMALLVIFICCNVYAGYVHAEWSSNPSVNTAICTAANDPYYYTTPIIISDGSGGAIITWNDGRRNGSIYDIYAQRINASGAVQWPVDGVAIRTTPDENYVPSDPAITSDGSGGAIITWVEGGSVSARAGMYAQRINASGVVQWQANGVAISTASNGSPYAPAIISDGSGGAIITWEGYRSDSVRIYAQRINASGSIQWPVDGVAICPATNGQYSPIIISDGSGGAIITWSDLRSGKLDIYAQRINASGAVQWAATGVAICTAANNQYSPAITSDGSGGAIITWSDRSDSNISIYAQRINASGAVQWPVDGVAICTEENSPLYYSLFPTITRDGNGGAIITWGDYRSGSNYGIYAQQINASGAVQWTANGVAIFTAADEKYHPPPAITSGGSGGAIITWVDSRNVRNFNIYAQRINASGAVQWTANGVAVCAAANNQYSPAITSDGSGGAIITWEDHRSIFNGDIYAQRIYANGTLTPTPTVCTATLDGNLLLHIPYLSLVNPASGTLSLWADLTYDSNTSTYDSNTGYANLISFKLTDYAIINDPSFSCAASTLSNNLTINIPDILLPDGTTHYWVELQYSPTLSTDGNFYWIVPYHGFVFF